MLISPAMKRFGISLRRTFIFSPETTCTSQGWVLQLLGAFIAVVNTDSSISGGTG